jgi:hypothetical protein
VVDVEVHVQVEVEVLVEVVVAVDVVEVVVLLVVAGKHEVTEEQRVAAWPSPSPSASQRQVPSAGWCWQPLGTCRLAASLPAGGATPRLRAARPHIAESVTGYMP